MTNITTTGLNIDECSDDELDAAIERGEVGYCEIFEHDVPIELMLPPIPLLGAPTESLHFCRVCTLPVAAAEIIERAINSEAIPDHDQAMTLVESYTAQGLYAQPTATALTHAIEQHRMHVRLREDTFDPEAARLARGEFKLGPVLTADADRVVAAVRATLGESPSEEDLFEFFLEEICISLDTHGVLKDTPDALAYVLDFDTLHDEYSTQAASPGWMVGEAAWKLVRDQVRKALGLPSLY
jgi:hypothetical protein